jgi:hypothetical protein
MKIWDIIKEDFEPKQPIEEGWKENVLATVISVAGIFGNLKAQNKIPADTNISVNQQVKNDSIKLDFGKVFHSGKYIFTQDESETLKGELRKLGAHLLKNQTSDFTIELVSSESRVPNYDMEPSSQTYKHRLEPGELAQKRAETARFILANFIEELKKDGVFTGKVNFVLPPKILIGDVPWPSSDANTGVQKKASDQSYTKDQYVYANVRIVNKKEAEYDQFAAYADIGEGIYFNNKLFGMVFVPSRETSDIKDAGNKNTGYQNLLFKIVKPETPISGNKNDKGAYLKSYIIPWQWWNQNITHKKLTKDNIDYIVSHFEVK